MPTLERLAAAHGWRLITLTKSACTLVRVGARRAGEAYPSCDEWREDTNDWIKRNNVDIMFTSLSRGHLRGDADLLAEGLRSVWSELMSAGMEVIPIYDTPWLPFEPGDCLVGEARQCSVPRQDVEAPDMIYRVAEGLEGIRVLDMTDATCSAQGT